MIPDDKPGQQTATLSHSSSYSATEPANRASWWQVPKLLAEAAASPSRAVELSDHIVAVALPLLLTLCTFQNHSRLGRLIGGALILAVVAWQIAKGHLSLKPLRVLLWPMLAVMAATLVSIVDSMDLTYSLKTFRNQHLLFPILTISVALWAVTPWRQLVVLRSLALAGFVSALFGIVLFYFAEPLHRIGLVEKVSHFVYTAADDDFQTYYRARGMLESYTRSAVVFVFALPATLALGLLATRERRWTSVAITALIAVLSVWYLLLTKTRGAWVCVALACLLTFVFLKGRLWVAALCLVLPAAMMLALPAARGRAMTMLEHVSKPDKLLSGRLTLWRQAEHAIRDNLWTGVGYGPDIFLRAPVREIYPLVTDRNQPDLHQMYLQTIAEVGLIGFAAYAWLFGTVLFVGGRAYWRGEFAQSPASGTALAVLGGMLLAGFVYAYNENHLAILLWTTWGVVVAVVGGRRQVAAERAA